MSHRRLPCLALALAMGLTACGGQEPSGTEPNGGDETPVDEAPVEGAPDDDTPPAAGFDVEETEERVRQQAADDLGVPVEEVEVATVEPVTWPDGALGCPEPDGFYTQALVPGYRATVVVDGEEHAYHGAQGQPPFRCEDPQPPAEG